VLQAGDEVLVLAEHAGSHAELGAVFCAPAERPEVAQSPLQPGGPD